MNKKQVTLNNEEDDEPSFGKQFLPYAKETVVNEVTIMTVFIDEPVQNASYYRNVVQGMQMLGEDDEVVFNIASPGGRADGLEVLLSAMNMTPAVTTANIMGDCSSAASMLALNCDQIMVSPYASMLCHYLQYGSHGAAAHVRVHVAHVEKHFEVIFRETYKYFLTEEEINKCIYDDYQLYLTSDEITSRLERKFNLMQKEQEKAEKEAKKAAKPPKPKPKSKKTIPAPEYDPKDAAFRNGNIPEQKDTLYSEET